MSWDDGSPTHGILFDTNSDRLKPESAAVIRSIARGLETNPALKLQIEGHRDSTGNADRNLDFSKLRAEAVKAVLVSPFSVDAGRLTTACAYRKLHRHAESTRSAPCGEDVKRR